MRAFHARWYQPSLMVLAVAGEVDHAEVVARAERLFPPVDPVAPPARTSPNGKASPVMVLRRPGEQVHLALAYRAVSRTDPDRKAFEKEADRLIEELRTERGRAFVEEWLKDRCEKLSKDGKIKPNPGLIREFDDKGNALPVTYKPCMYWAR